MQLCICLVASPFPRACVCMCVQAVTSDLDMPATMRTTPCMVPAQPAMMQRRPPAKAATAPAGPMVRQHLPTPPSLSFTCGHSSASSADNSMAMRLCRADALTAEQQDSPSCKRRCVSMPLPEVQLQQHASLPAKRARVCLDSPLKQAFSLPAPLMAAKADAQGPARALPPLLASLAGMSKPKHAPPPPPLPPAARQLQLGPIPDVRGQNPFAKLQALLDWQALSHRVVTAVSSPNQAAAWNLMSDEELLRFLARTPMQRGMPQLNSRAQLINTVRQVVMAARGNGRQVGGNMLR